MPLLNEGCGSGEQGLTKTLYQLMIKLFKIALYS